MDEVKTPKTVRKASEGAVWKRTDQTEAQSASTPAKVVETPTQAEATSEAPKTKKSAKPVDDRPRCQYCGKLVGKPNSVDEQAGDLCQHYYVEQGLTGADMVAQRLLLTVQDEPNPDQYIKLAAVGKIYEKKGLPISRLVKGIGGDRSFGAVVDERCRPVYFRGVRYVDRWIISEEGIKAIMGDKPLRGKQSEGSTVTAKAELAKAE